MTGEACIEFRQLEMIWKRSYSLQIHIIYSPKKTADISRRHHWFPSLPHTRTRSLPAWRTPKNVFVGGYKFPREMTSEERAQKFHTDDVSLVTLIGRAATESCFNCRFN